MTKKNLSFYKTYLIRLLNKYFEKENKRKCKFSVRHKLEVIIRILQNGIPWTSLNEQGNESTYRKFYYTLVKEKIFQKAYANLVNCIFKKTIRRDVSFIDSTTILNKLGSKCFINYCSKDRKHKGVKITTIVNENQVPLGISFEKGSVHDINLVEPTLENIIEKPHFVIGDKGYISKKLKNKLASKNISLIYPFRNYNKSKTLSSEAIKKSKIASKDGNKKHKKDTYPKNTDEEKKLLKKRYLVEHFFSYLKKFRRISFIYDRKKEYFEGFCYLAFSLILIKKCLEL